MSLFAPGFVHPGYPSGQYISMSPCHFAGAAIAAIDIIYFHPVWVLAPINFASMHIRVSTGGAGSSLKGGFYANSVANKPIGAPLYKDDTGVASTSNTTTVTLATGAGAVAPGLYWFGSKTTGTPPTVVCSSTAWVFLHWIAGGTSIGGLHTGYSFADTYSNNMPTLTGASSFTATQLAAPLGMFLTA